MAYSKFYLSPSHFTMINRSIHMAPFATIIVLTQSKVTQITTLRSHTGAFLTVRAPHSREAGAIGIQLRSQRNKSHSHSTQRRNSKSSPSKRLGFLTNGPNMAAIRMRCIQIS